MPDELTPSSDFFTDVRSILADACKAFGGDPKPITVELNSILVA